MRRRSSPPSSGSPPHELGPGAKIGRVTRAGCDAGIFRVQGTPHRSPTSQGAGRPLHRTLDARGISQDRGRVFELGFETRHSRASCLSSHSTSSDLVPGPDGTRVVAGRDGGSRVNATALVLGLAGQQKTKLSCVSGIQIQKSPQAAAIAQRYISAPPREPECSVAGAIA
jgi:hypothetical protein